MHIVIDLQACQNGSRNRGIGRYALSLTKALVAVSAGRHRISVVLSNRFPEMIASLRRSLSDVILSDDIHVFNVMSRISEADEANAWRRSVSMRAREKAIDALKPDVVFDPSPLEGLWDDTVTSTWSGRHINVVTLHDLIPLEDPECYLPHEKDLAAYFRRLQQVRKADLVLAVSEFTKNQAVELLGIDPRKIVVAQLGADEALFTRINCDFGNVSEALSRLNISGDFVLNASPLEARKNIEGLIAGFSQLSPQVRASLKLVIVGRFDAYAHQYIRGLAIAEGIDPDQVILPGYVSDADLSILYAACNAFVFPSYSEGFGLPALEAMASGAPVIGSNVTSIPEVIGRQDLLFDPADPVSIAQKLEKVLTSEVFRNDVCNYGLQRAAVFTWRRTAEIVLNTFEDLWDVSTRETPSSPYSVAKKPVVFFWPISHKSGRLHGIARRIVEYLSLTRSVTIIEREPIKKDAWMSAVAEFHPSSWLREQDVSNFDFIHCLDSASRVSDIHDVTMYFGKVIIADDVFLSPEKLDSTAALWVDDAMNHLGGYILSDIIRQGIAGTAVMSGGTFDGLGDVCLLCPPDSINNPVAAGVTRLPLMPISRSKQLGDRFRDSHSIKSGKLVVCFVKSQERGGEFINWARRERLGENIFIQYTAPTSGIKIGTLIADIRCECFANFDYDGLLNAADHVVLMDTRYESVIACDCAAMGVKVSRFDGSILTDLATEPVLAAERQLIDWLCAPTAQPLELLRELPHPVRGVAPSAEDITDLTVALDMNADLSKAPRILFDVTGLGDSKRRLSTSRMAAFLSGLMAARHQGERIYLCQRSNEMIEVAGGVEARLFSLSPDWALERPIYPRAGDLLVYSDLDANAARAATDATGCLHIIECVFLTLGLLLRGPKVNASVIGEAIGLFLLRNRQSIIADEALQIPLGQTVPIAFASIVTVMQDMNATVRILDTENAASRTGLSSKLRAEVSDAVLQAANAITARKPSVPENYVVFGHILGTYSLAIINRSVAQALEEAYPDKVRVIAMETLPVHDFSTLNEPDRSLITRLAHKSASFGYPEIAICQHYPILPPPDNAIGVCLFPWEETKVPQRLVDDLNANFHAIIAPARSVEKALLDSGVRIPVGAIGQPTQLSSYYNAAGPRKRTPNEPIIFLHVSSCFPRKGADILLRGWQRAFRKSDAVRLVIKTFPNPHNTIEQDVAALLANDPEIGAIEIINRDMTEAEMIDLYSRVHVMVLPTRGEGFNLPALEAMLAGLPVIVTNFGGQADFCTAETARLLDFDFSLSESHVADAHSMWVNVKVKDLADALREQIDPLQFDSIRSRALEAQACALEVADNAAWVERLNDWLDRVLRAPMIENEDRIGWITTWDVRCGIAQYSSFLLSTLDKENRSNVRILCDWRTRPDESTGVAACWGVQQADFKETVFREIEQNDLSAIVLQHQDGLISWDSLADFAMDSRLRSRTSIFVLHNPKGLLIPSDEERPRIVEALRSVDRLLVHSVADVNLLKQIGLVDNVTLLPHGAGRAMIRAGKAATIQNRAPVIGCHGFFFFHKGIEKLVEAVNLLKPKWPDIRLRLLNARFPDPVSDAAIASCQDLVRKLGIERHIEWELDFLDVDVIQHKLSECDLLVLPYDQSQDSASGAARICMSSGVPVIATDVNIFAEFRLAVSIIADNRAETIASRIDALLNSPKDRQSIQVSMEEWLSTVEWPVMMKRLESIICSLRIKRIIGHYT